MDSGMGLWVLLLLLSVAIVAQTVSLVVQLYQSWWMKRPRNTRWVLCGLQTTGDDWRVRDVRWRQGNGHVEVEYSIENHRPGRTWYRNDLIRVFQRGVGLEEEDDRVSRVLLKGAETRFVQTFRTRDDSVPVIQIDSSYTPTRN